MVDDLHVAGSVFRPAETDAPLGIDPDAVLARAVSAKCLQPIASQTGQVTQSVGTVEDGQAANGLVRECLEARDTASLEEPSGISVLEASDHASVGERFLL